MLRLRYLQVGVASLWCLMMQFCLLSPLSRRNLVISGWTPLIVNLRFVTNIDLDRLMCCLCLIDSCSITTLASTRVRMVVLSYSRTRAFLMFPGVSFHLFSLIYGPRCITTPAVVGGLCFTSKWWLRLSRSFFNKRMITTGSGPYLLTRMALVLTWIF